MPRGKACHFSHDSSSIHDSSSHERTRAQAEPQNEVEPSGPPQAQAEPWLPHRPNKLFSSRPEKARGRPGRNYRSASLHDAASMVLLRELPMPMPACSIFQERRLGATEQNSIAKKLAFIDSKGFRWAVYR